MTEAKLPGALIITALACLALSCAAQVPADREVASEPALMLVDQETFGAELGDGWSLPPGWTRAVIGDGFALHIAAAQAGLNSAARPEGIFNDVAIDGHFTFTGVAGTAQLFARDSAAGSYVAQLDAAGRVMLEKRGSGGVVIASWSATAEPQAVPGSARAMQLSAMGGALRVTVDDIDVLTVKDAAPLPPGANKIGAAFAAPEGTLTFDNYFVWAPSDNLDQASPEAPPTPAPPAKPASQQPPSTMAREAASAPPGAPPPPNDLFTNRLPVVQVRYHDVGNNTAATPNEIGEPVPSHGADISKTVWYQFTPPASKPYLLTSFGSSFNTVMAVYTGTGTLGSLTEVASSDDVTGSLQAQLILPLGAAQTYYIQLGGRSGAEGDFEFYIIDPSDALVPSTPTISGSASGVPFPPVANLGVTSNLQPVVAWMPRPTVTPYAYLAEVSTVSNFSSIVRSGVVTEPARFWQVAPALSASTLPVGQKYYWRVTAMNFLGQASTRSPAYSFSLDTQAPAPPALISPVLNGVISTLCPTLKWQPVAYATGYHAVIATNFSASTPVSAENDVDVTATSFTSPGLNQGEYWFAVKSRDAAGNWSSYGEKRRFAVNLSLAPGNGANVTATAPSYTPNVVLTWASVPGATYNLQIAPDSSFTFMVVDTVITGTSYTATGLPVGNYYWRVGVNGNNLPSSLAHSFNVTPALPVAPLVQTTGAQAGAVTSGGFTNDQTPVFDWTAPANWASPPPGSSLTYELQLATDSAFTQMVAPPVTGISNSHYEWTVLDLPLSPGTTYYWRVRAVTNLGLAGAFSAAYPFMLDTQAPVPPALTSPAVDGVVSTLRPTLTWQPVGDANRYRVRIATDSAGANAVAGGETEVAASAFTPAVDMPQGEYWFCVESRDAADNWSGFVGEKRRFVINVSLTPGNGANAIASPPLFTPNVVLTWTKVTGATYGLQVATEPSFTAPMVDIGSLTGTSYTVASLPVGTYYWRVAVSGQGLPAPLARSFHVTPAPPMAPFIQTTGVQPGAVTSGGVTNDDTPVFDWTVPANWGSPPSGSTLTYELQLATDSTFTQMVAGAPVMVGANSHFEWGISPLPQGTYYWRVRAVTNLGLMGGFSLPYRFTLDTQAPAAPVLLSPAVNSAVTSLRPTLVWKPVSDASRYRARIATNFSASTVFPGAEAEVTAPVYTPTVTVPQGEYWFAVESRDAAGNWSGFVGEKRRFIINVSLTPANGTNVIATAPLYAPDVVLTWAKVTGATYNLQVATDSSFTAMVVDNVPVTGTNYTLTSLPVGTYYWRVTVNGNGLPMSLARSFNVTPALPVAPLIQTAGALSGAVTNGGVTNDDTPILDWTVPANRGSPPPGSSLTYELQLATDSTFTQTVAGFPVAGIGSSDCELLTALPTGTYYWRVRAVTNLGLVSPYSAAYSFTLN